MNILDEARHLRSLIEMMAESLDDETAEQNPNVFAEWEIGKEYKKDYKFRYQNVVYKVLQDHTSQADWTPDVAVSLYVRVHHQPGEEWPQWVQPQGAHDVYSLGDKVTHNEKHWISNCDNNSWEPGVYGWDEVVEETEPTEEPVEEPTEEIAEWVQPTGAHDSYAYGTKVTHNGKVWVSTIDANVYEPGVYGWDEVE